MSDSGPLLRLAYAGNLPDSPPLRHLQLLAGLSPETFRRWHTMGNSFHDLFPAGPVITSGRVARPGHRVYKRRCG